MMFVMFANLSVSALRAIAQIGGNPLFLCYVVYNKIIIKIFISPHRFKLQPVRVYLQRTLVVQTYTVGKSFIRLYTDYKNKNISNMLDKMSDRPLALLLFGCSRGNLF